MPNRKILFLDIDDTLLTTDKELTEENRRAMEKALEAGHKLVICTGRPHFGAWYIAERYHLADPGFFLISYNGGQIYDCSLQKSIFRKSLDPADVKLLFEIADRLGLHLQSYSDKELLIRELNKESESYLFHVKCDYRIVPELPEGVSVPPGKVLSISLDHPEKLDEFRRCADELVGDRISSFYSHPTYLEFVPKGISKGFAVRFLCEHLGIPIQNSIAAGDMENDISMIETAGVGCAMANASPQVKAVADYVTVKDCNNSGVAEIINRFML